MDDRTVRESEMQASATETFPVRFTGNAREYFGIWIVNFLLSIATLGIYSAWAKVRNRRYFLGNTSIDGRPFDYHARGVQILIGRAIVVAMFVAYSVASSLSPTAGGVVLLLFAAILPWLINRGLRFNAAMTSWSNLRFRFEGNYWRAFLVYLLYPFLAVFSLYLAFPFVSRAMRRYTIGRHRLGEHRFAFDSGIGPFYTALLVTFVWLVLGFVAFVGVLAASGMVERVVAAAQAGEAIDDTTALVFALVSAIWFVAIFPLGTVYAACIRNAVYAGTALEGGHRFQSTISPLRLVWIAVSNAVAVMVSIGMLLPWARIRVARYLCAHTSVTPAGSLDNFVGEAERRQSALGDAFMDIEGIDVGAAV